MQAPGGCRRPWVERAAAGTLSVCPDFVATARDYPPIGRPQGWSRGWGVFGSRPSQRGAGLALSRTARTASTSMCRSCLSGGPRSAFGVDTATASVDHGGPLGSSVAPRARTLLCRSDRVLCSIICGVDCGVASCARWQELSRISSLDAEVRRTPCPPASLYSPLLVIRVSLNAPETRRFGVAKDHERTPVAPVMSPSASRPD
jgi:hypothetical protein